MEPKAGLVVMRCRLSLGLARLFIGVGVRISIALIVEYKPGCTRENSTIGAILSVPQMPMKTLSYIYAINVMSRSTSALVVIGCWNR